MPLPDAVQDLVARYTGNRAQYHSTHYNETQTRIDFVNPLFAALGWDMDNRQGLPEAYRQVVHEDAIKIGGTTKAPDYSFRVGGQRKFFLETKKPGVGLFAKSEPAYQLRRYAWTAGMPVSILTNFEEFVIYDGRVAPDQKDSPKRARLDYFKYTDYPDKWDELAARFSQAAVQEGAFDKYAEEAALFKAATPVDAAFLAQISGWREKLARSLAQQNAALSPRDLNFAVQMIIDRLIFLRICEDRGVEAEHTLRPLLNGLHTYPRLLELFHHADDRYNSGLFHFQKEKGRENFDDVTPRLSLDDRTLKEIIAGVYYPESPFEFSVFPADILGQVYEQFLGQVIRVEGRTAVVEPKPEVKKAGGVYYTPTYIVDYIVQQTVGKLVEGKTPKQVANLKILDPACGSGSFLIGAYQFLLDWHAAWYVGDGADKYAKGKSATIYQAQGGVWRLTTAEKKRILLNNIYGVDIDTQAVEVTKLSLLLKVLEGESAETVNSNLKLFKERALPTLESNIKCGNSLIGPDFYTDKDMALFDLEAQITINAFDWGTEFAKIMNSGGFDVVIGNPPWVSLSGKFGNEICTEAEIKYLIKVFNGNTYMPNLYEYFVNRGLELSKISGRFSFIVPDRLGFNGQFVELRKRIISETYIVSLLYKVPFPGVTADTLVFVLEKGNGDTNHLANISEYGGPVEQYKQDKILPPLYVFEYFEDAPTRTLMANIQSRLNVVPLSSIFDTTSGFGGKSELIYALKTKPEQIVTIKGDSIGRYEMRQTYWFDFKKENITGRTTDKAKLGASPRVLLRKTGSTIIATYDDSAIFPEQSLYFLFNNQSLLDSKYVLGILNSRMMSAYYQAKSLTNKKSIAQVKKVDLDQLPIRTINFDDPADKARHDKMVSLVERMLTLNKELPGKTGQERAVMQRQIEATDKQIDALVYELYGLTEDEIKIVEGQAG